MIDSVTTPKCFSAFSSQKKEQKRCEVSPKVKLASIAGAGICALGTAHLIARRQSKLFSKPVNLLNVKYSEPEMISVAIASIFGGLGLGGLADDKKYFPIKVKEGIHQTIANILAPLLLIGGLNKIYEKFPVKNFPQFEATTKLRKFANEGIKMLPRLGIAIAGLVGGVSLGTVISNKLNGIENTKHERQVKAIDYIYHPDDVAAVFAIADKKGVLQKIVGKIIPPVFMLHGYETGTRR